LQLAVVTYRLMLSEDAAVATSAAASTPHRTADWPACSQR
jgi:hypothetical protein